MDRANASIRRSTRVIANESLREMRRKEEEEAPARALLKAKEQKLQKESRVIARFFKNLVQILPRPERCEDYDITDSWKASAIIVDDYPRYRFIKKNFYQAPLHRILCPLEDVPACQCKPETGCNEDCQNRLLFMECAPGYCSSKKVKSLNSKMPKFRNLKDVKGRQGFLHGTDDEDSEGAEDVELFCENTVVQTRAYPRTEVIKTSSCGYGLRIMESVPAGRMLIEYTGEVITSEECKARMARLLPSDDFYFASLGGALMVDAKKMGSPARFANHSCDPTCALQKWSVLGESRLVLVSLRPMDAGTEITYNYQYFDDGLDGLSSMKRQQCLCGSANCCGTIGGRVITSERNLWVTKATNILSGSRRVNLEYVLSHIDGAASAGVDDSSSELIRLRELVGDTQRWIAEKDTLLNPPIGTVLVDISTAKALLERLPVCIKLEEAVQLDQMIKRAVRLEVEIMDMWKQFIGPLSADKTAAGRSSSSSSLTDDHSYEIIKTESFQPLDQLFHKYVPAATKACDISATVNTCLVSQSSDNGDKTFNHPTNEESQCDGSGRNCMTFYSSDKVMSCTASETRVINGNKEGLGDESAVDMAVDVPLLPSIGTCARSNSDFDKTTVYSDTSQTYSVETISQLPPVILQSPYGQLESTKSDQSMQSQSYQVVTTTSLPGVHSSEPSTPSSRRQVPWDNLMNICKELAAVAPLRCHGVAFLLELFQEYNDWVYRSFGDIVPALQSPIYPQDTKIPLKNTGIIDKVQGSLKSEVSSHSPEISTETCAKKGSNTRAPKGAGRFKGEGRNCVIVKKVFSYYSCTEDAHLQLTPVTRSYTVANIAFIVEKFLDIRLSSFMERAHDTRERYLSAEAVEEEPSDGTISTEDDSCLVITQTNNDKDGGSSSTADDSMNASTDYESTSTITTATTLLAALPDAINCSRSKRRDDRRAISTVNKFTARKSSEMITALCSQSPNTQDFDDVTVLLQSVSSNEASTNGTSVERYCFCRLPEHDSEIALMSECDVCRQWFHRHCVNSSSVSLSSSSKGSFICPICLHLLNRPSCFAFAPVTEWKQSPAPLQQQHKRKSSNRTGFKKTRHSKSVVSLQKPKVASTSSTNGCNEMLTDDSCKGVDSTSSSTIPTAKDNSVDRKRRRTDGGRVKPGTSRIKKKKRVTKSTSTKRMSGSCKQKQKQKIMKKRKRATTTTSAASRSSSQSSIRKCNRTSLKISQSRRKASNVANKNNKMENYCQETSPNTGEIAFCTVPPLAAHLAIKTEDSRAMSSMPPMRGVEDGFCNKKDDVVHSPTGDEEAAVILLSEAEYSSSVICTSLPVLDLRSQQQIGSDELAAAGIWTRGTTAIPSISHFEKNEKDDVGNDGISQPLEEQIITNPHLRASDGVMLMSQEDGGSMMMEFCSQKDKTAHRKGDQTATNDEERMILNNSNEKNTFKRTKSNQNEGPVNGTSKKQKKQKRNRTATITDGLVTSSTTNTLPSRRKTTRTTTTSSNNSDSRLASRRDPLLLSELHDIIKEGLTLRIANAPILLLANLCVRFIDSWKKKVLDFFNREYVCAMWHIEEQEACLEDRGRLFPQVQQPSNHSMTRPTPFQKKPPTLPKGAAALSGAPISTATSVTAALQALQLPPVPPSQLQLEAQVLRHALQLFFELRILRVWPDEFMVRLRRLIWVISARTVIRHTAPTSTPGPPNAPFPMHRNAGATSETVGTECLENTALCHEINPIRPVDAIGEKHQRKARPHIDPCLPTLTCLAQIIQGGEAMLRSIHDSRDHTRVKKCKNVIRIHKRNTVAALTKTSGITSNTSQQSMSSIKDTATAAATSSIEQQLSEEDRKSPEIRAILALMQRFQKLHSVGSTALMVAMTVLPVLAESSSCSIQTSTTQPFAPGYEAPLLHQKGNDCVLRGVDDCCVDVFTVRNDDDSNTLQSLGLSAVPSACSSISTDVLNLALRNMCRLKEALTQLMEVGKWVDVKEEYAFVRVMSLYVAGQRKLSVLMSTMTMMGEKIEGCEEEDTGVAMMRMSADGNSVLDLSEIIRSTNKQLAGTMTGFPFYDLADVTEMKRRHVTSDEVVYCWCRRVDDGSPMIACDECDEWFHCRCVGVKAGKQFAAFGAEQGSVYHCIDCAESKGLRYAFAWFGGRRTTGKCL